LVTAWLLFFSLHECGVARGGISVYLAATLHQGVSTSGRVLLVVFALLVGLVLCWWRVPLEQSEVRDHLRGFPDSDHFMHGIRPYVMAVVFFLPFLGAVMYATAGIMARWLAREFLQAMLVCYGGILLIYFLIDFSGNAARLGEGGDVGMGTWMYYSRLAPSIVTLLLPFGMLFSVMYCVVRVSRSREVVAALQSGRSMLRVMAPLYVCGLLGSLFYLGCNFHWAPMAEGTKSANMDEARGKTGKLMNHTVFYYAKGRRMWMVTEFPRGYDRGIPLRGVEVTSLNKDGSLASRLYAKEATWSETERSWRFIDVELTDHHKNQAPVFVSPPNPYVKTSWSETPAQIVQQGLDVRHLGMPDLSGMIHTEVKAEWLKQDSARYATQWHYRMALPSTCLVYVMFAVPLSLFVTRRAHGGTMALTIVMAIHLVLFTSVALALGESGNLSPALAAWVPVALFGLLGCWLMKRRMAGRALWPLFG
jgi:lipopolysaccharide export system permease protein